MRKLLVGLFVGCGILVVIDVIFRVTGYDKHPYFQWEQWPAFYGVYGFVASVIMIFAAKYLLRPLVKRSGDYYEPKVVKEGGADDE
ncbi:MAG: hypothetical protein AAF357_03690 [Verrucomicrobiota bacterium]